MREGREALSAGRRTCRVRRAERGARAVARPAARRSRATSPSRSAELARLEELRLAALEDRLEADLALGRHAELVAELEALVAEHPLRERLRGHLMLALYRSGRQAEALAVYRATRRALVDELGIEPGRALRELERAILAQDAELEPRRRAHESATQRSSGASANWRSCSRGSRQALPEPAE